MIDDDNISSQHRSLRSSSTKSLTGGNMAEEAQTTLRLGKYSRDRKETSTGTRDATHWQVCLFKIRVLNLPPLTDYLQLEYV
jgi:hypothetical protein